MTQKQAAAFMGGVGYGLWIGYYMPTFTGINFYLFAIGVVALIVAGYALDIRGGGEL